MPTRTRRRTPLPSHLVRKISVEAPADPRSVRKVLLGEPVAIMTRERIVRALREHGLKQLVPLQPAAEVERP
jgi:hypothetical protein